MDRSAIDSHNRTYQEAQSNMELLPNYYAWIYRKFGAVIHGEAIDLGCGAGVGIQYYLDRVNHVYAVDYNAELLARIKRIALADKVDTVCVDLLGDWSGLAGIHADVVIMMDVLEHFSDDHAFVLKTKELLKPEGRLAIKVPAQKLLFSPVDQVSGHYRRYDKDDLIRLMEDVGFRTIKVEHMNPLGSWAYRFKKGNSTNFSRTFSPLQLWSINKLIPVIEMFDAIPILKGLSLIGVFQKA